MSSLKENVSFFSFIFSNFNKKFLLAERRVSSPQEIEELIKEDSALSRVLQQLKEWNVPFHSEVSYSKEWDGLAMEEWVNTYFSIAIDKDFLREKLKELFSILKKEERDLLIIEYIFSETFSNEIAEKLRNFLKEKGLLVDGAPNLVISISEMVSNILGIKDKNIILKAIKYSNFFSDEELIRKVEEINPETIRNYEIKIFKNELNKFKKEKEIMELVKIISNLQQQISNVKEPTKQQLALAVAKLGEKIIFDRNIDIKEKWKVIKEQLYQKFDYIGGFDKMIIKYKERKIILDEYKVTFSDLRNITETEAIKILTDYNNYKNSEEIKKQLNFRITDLENEIDKIKDDYLININLLLIATDRNVAREYLGDSLYNFYLNTYSFLFI